MEKTISRILEIEEKAKLIIDRANKQKSTLHDEFEQELMKMEKDIADETASKIRKFQAGINKELEEEEKLLTQKSDKHLKELEELYTQHHIEIVDKIFEGIIN